MCVRLCVCAARRPLSSVHVSGRLFIPNASTTTIASFQSGRPAATLAPRTRPESARQSSRLTTLRSEWSRNWRPPMEVNSRLIGPSASLRVGGNSSGLGQRRAPAGPPVARLRHVRLSAGTLRSSGGQTGPREWPDKSRLQDRRRPHWAHINWRRT